MNYNKIMVAGRMTRDPESKTTASGKKVTTFALAVNRRVGEREEVLFLDCEAWERTADVVAKYVRKGDPLFVEGRLRQDAWTASDGSKRSKIVVVAEGVQLLGSRDGAAGRAGSGIGVEPTGEAKTAQPRAAPAAIPAVDEIPF